MKRHVPLLLAVLAMLQAAIACADPPLAFGEKLARKTAWVLDHGLRPKAYPKYLGKDRGLGWQDLYNQDETGAYFLEREFEFRNTRIDLRLTQAYVGDASHPLGRLALRYPKSHRKVTPTQPEWLSTWCRFDDTFPGMLDVTIDGKGLEGVPPEFASGSEGAVAFVRCTWKREDGSVAATFLMLPDDDRLFCEVAVRPVDLKACVAVSLNCWPLGKPTFRTVGKTSEALKYRQAYALPEGDATVLFTDPTYDLDGRVNFGTCALTCVPGECASVTVERTFPASVTLNVAPREGAAYAHFVLWELLQRRGDEAFTYVLDREDDTLSMFGRLSGITDPRFAEPRDKHVAEVKVKLAEIDTVLKKADTTKPSISTRWALFYRDEAEYYLPFGDWQRAMKALAKCKRFLHNRLPSSQ